MSGVTFNFFLKLLIWLFIAFREYSLYSSFQTISAIISYVNTRRGFKISNDRMSNSFAVNCISCPYTSTERYSMQKCNESTVHAKQVFAGGRLYFLPASPPHKQKNTKTYLLHSYTFPSKNQHFPLLKNPAALTSSSSPSHIFFSYTYPSTIQKLPIYNA